MQATTIGRRWWQGWQGFALLLGALATACGSTETAERPYDPAPTLQPGGRIDIDGVVYILNQPQRGELVSFFGPGGVDVWVFRVVALPGEVVSLSGSDLAVDGAKVRTPAGLSIAPAPTNVLGAPTRASFPYLVPADRYFVVGDNPEGGAASRFWGTLPLKVITGRVTPR